MVQGVWKLLEAHWSALIRGQRNFRQEESTLWSHLAGSVSVLRTPTCGPSLWGTDEESLSPVLHILQRLVSHPMAFLLGEKGT